MQYEAGREQQIPLIDGVDVREGLMRVSGNTKVYKKLLRSFVDGNARFYESLMSALENADIASATMLVHTLKGVAGNLGARELFRLSQKMEGELKNDPVHIGRVDACFQDVVSELNRVMDAVERALQAEGDVPATKKTAPDVERTRALLLRLESALQEYDTTSSELVEELEEAAGEAFMSGELRRIRVLIEEFEYEKALAELKTLAFRK